VNWLDIMKEILEDYFWSNIHQDGELIWIRTKIVILLMAVYLITMGTIVLKKNISWEKNARIHLILGTIGTFLAIGYILGLWLFGLIGSIIFYLWYRWCCE